MYKEPFYFFTSSFMPWDYDWIRPASCNDATTSTTAADRSQWCQFSQWCSVCQRMEDRIQWPLTYCLISRPAFSANDEDNAIAPQNSLSHGGKKIICDSVDKRTLSVFYVNNLPCSCKIWRKKHWISFKLFTQNDLFKTSPSSLSRGRYGVFRCKL